MLTVAANLVIAVHLPHYITRSSSKLTESFAFVYMPEMYKIWQPAKKILDLNVTLSFNVNIIHALTKTAETSPVQSVTCRGDISHICNHHCRFEHDIGSHNVTECKTNRDYRNVKPC